MQISDSIHYVGVNDHEIDLFEGQYAVPHGMSYNSYLIVDQETAVMDSVESPFGPEWIANIRSVLADRQPDYLIVQHMEPDHSGSIDQFMKAFPHALVVSSAKAIHMMKQFFGTDFCGRSITISDRSNLSLGRHHLNFVAAPMVHWPEVMMTYESTEKILFSADAFGKFGALDEEEPWDDEARRYYIGIVGKYGPQVQNVFAKIGGLNIRKICSLHGPVLSEDLGHYLGLYQKWSTYEPEEEGIVIAFTSVYGHTRQAVAKLADILENKGHKVVVRDLARTDMSETLADVFRYSKLVLATTTYNACLFPFMHDFLDRLVEHNFQNRTVGIIENGSWVPMAAKLIKGMLGSCRNISFPETTVTIRSALNEESTQQLNSLAEELSR